MLLNCPTGFQNTVYNTKPAFGAVCEKGWFWQSEHRVMYKICPDNFKEAVGIMEARGSVGRVTVREGVWQSVLDKREIQIIS